MSAAAATSPQPELLDAVEWIDARVRDALGRRVGRVAAVWADRDGRPWWIAVRRRGRTLVAPVTAVCGASRHELLLGCTADALVPAGDSIDHEALIRRFGLDRRHPAGRMRDRCAPAPAVERRRRPRG